MNRIGYGFSIIKPLNPQIMKEYKSSRILNQVCLWALILIVTACTSENSNIQNKETGIEEVSFITTDGVEVFGDLYTSKNSKGTLLLFHQGGSNARAEYEGILERLQNFGLTILAIDQRSGGQMYGSYNRTIYNMDPFVGYPMCAAYTDLEASLQYALDNNLSNPIIVLGSSYSAALAVQLAAKYQDSIDGILAFSPASGGPMADCKIDPYVDGLEVPLMVFRPTNEAQIPSVVEQLEMVRAAGHEVYVAENGNHGSSLLHPDRVEGSVAENWAAVEEFIIKIIEK